MAVGDVYRMSATAQGLNSLYMNTIALYQKTSAVTVADFTSVANALRELFRTQQNNQFTWRSWRAIQVRGGDVTPIRDECKREGGVVFEAAYTGSSTGVTSGDALPPQASLVLTLASGKLGRRFRGRLYGFGYSESDQANGVFISSFMTAITTAATTFRNLYAADGTDPTWTVGIWSERIATGCVPDASGKNMHNVDAPNLAAAFTAMQSLTPRSTVFTQRRRAIGVGR